jgi:hypothetical protein
VDIYSALIPGIREIIEASGCRLQANFPNDMCYFGDKGVEIDRDKISSMANGGDYKGVIGEISGLIKAVNPPDTPPVEHVKQMVDIMADPFAAVVRVPSGEFPDCCLVCTFGRRYYGRIQCACGPSRVEYREINDVCGHFERGGV